MAHFYQAVLRDDGDELGPRLRRCFTDWTGVADEGVSSFDTARGSLDIRVTDSPVCGRYITKEQTADGRIRTIITWARAPQATSGWATVIIDGDDATEPELVDAPGVIADFLPTGHPTDGVVPLETMPHLISIDELDQLVEWLTHPARRVPIVVLTPDNGVPDAPAQNATRLAEALAGIVVVVRLYDYRTQEVLNTRLGDGLMVFGGGLRTYMPHLTLGAESYPHRHPVRSGQALRDLGSRALDIVISGITNESVRRGLPQDIKQDTHLVGRILTGEATPDLLLAPRSTATQLACAKPQDPPMVVTVPAPATKPLLEIIEVPQATVPGPVELPAAQPQYEARPANLSDEAVTQISNRVADRVADQLRAEIMTAFEAVSGKTNLADTEALRSVQAMCAHVKAHMTVRQELDKSLLLQRAAATRSAETEHEMIELEGELDQHHQAYELLELQYDESVEDGRRAQERIRWLEGLLSERSQPVYGIDTPEEVWIPESLMDVLVRAREALTQVDLPHTLDDDAAKLDVTHPRLCRVWAGKAWDALRALDAYATARTAGQFSGGFYQWCSRPPPGEPAITLNMVSMKESDLVGSRAKYRDPRTFQVPREVDSSGEVLMEAHIKLQQGGYPAPRMHFLDDAGGSTGKIWIGYLGDHLPNTRTN